MAATETQRGGQERPLTGTRRQPYTATDGDMKSGQEWALMRSKGSHTRLLTEDEGQPKMAAD